MKNPWIFPAASLVIGALGGFLAGKNTGGAPGTTAANEETASQSRSRANASRGDGVADAKRSGNRGKGIDEILREPGQSNRLESLMRYYSNLTPEQLEAEAAKLEDLPMSERMVASFLLFGKWAETDAIGAMAYASKIGFAGNFVKPTILQSWASKDPEGAAKYYSENPREFAMMGVMGGGRGPMGMGGGASTIASEWARQDPAAAMAWASTLSGNEKGSAMTAVVREVANSDPAKAWSMVNSMDADEQSRAYSEIASRWAGKDFAAAEAMIRGLPTDQQAEAMASAINGLSRTDPQQAAAKAAAMAAGEERDNALRSVASNWSRQDPQAAAAWVMSQGDAETQSRAIGEVMTNWVSQDEKGALGFLNSQQPGDVRDRAAASYIMSSRNQNGSELIKIAESISDNDSRERTVRMTAMRWIGEDPAAANTYIQSSDLFTEEMKTRAAEGRPIFGREGRGPGGRGGQ